jgi:hypothetical protein
MIRWIRLLLVGSALGLPTVTYAQNVHSESYDLEIGYELPKNADLKSAAMGVEASCLSKRNMEVQSCAGGRNEDQCEDNAEIAFRRCISGVSEIRFVLALKSEQREYVEGVQFPLSADDAIHPRLNLLLPHLRSAHWYSRTGIRVDLKDPAEPGGACLFVRADSGAKMNLPHQGELCQVLQNFRELRKLPYMPWNELEQAIRKHQTDLVRFLSLRATRSRLDEALLSFSSTDLVAWHFEDQESGAIVEILLAAGADPNTNQAGEVGHFEDGFTPLHWAVFGNHLTAAEVLIEHRANVNATNRSGATPLHVAAQRSNRSAVELLVGHGGEVNAKDDRGRIPADVVGYEFMERRLSDLDHASPRPPTPTEQAIIKYLHKRGGQK